MATRRKQTLADIEGPQATHQLSGFQGLRVRGNVSTRRQRFVPSREMVDFSKFSTTLAKNLQIMRGQAKAEDDLAQEIGDREVKSGMAISRKIAVTEVELEADRGSPMPSTDGPPEMDVDENGNLQPVPPVLLSPPPQSPQSRKVADQIGVAAASGLLPPLANVVLSGLSAQAAGQTAAVKAYEMLKSGIPMASSWVVDPANGSSVPGGPQLSIEDWGREIYEQAKKQWRFLDKTAGDDIYNPMAHAVFLRGWERAMTDVKMKVKADLNTSMLEQTKNKVFLPGMMAAWKHAVDVDPTIIDFDPSKQGVEAYQAKASELIQAQLEVLWRAGHYRSELPKMVSDSITLAMEEIIRDTRTSQLDRSEKLSDLLKVSGDVKMGGQFLRDTPWFQQNIANAISSKLEIMHKGGVGITPVMQSEIVMESTHEMAAQLDALLNDKDLSNDQGAIRSFLGEHNAAVERGLDKRGIEGVDRTATLLRARKMAPQMVAQVNDARQAHSDQLISSLMRELSMGKDPDAVITESFQKLESGQTTWASHLKIVAAAEGSADVSASTAPGTVAATRFTELRSVASSLRGDPTRKASFVRGMEEGIIEANRGLAAAVRGKAGAERREAEAAYWAGPGKAALQPAFDQAKVLESEVSTAKGELVQMTNNLHRITREEADTYRGVLGDEVVELHLQKNHLETKASTLAEKPVFARQILRAQDRAHLKASQEAVTIAKGDPQIAKDLNDILKQNLSKRIRNRGLELIGQLTGENHTDIAQEFSQRMEKIAEEEEESVREMAKSEDLNRKSAIQKNRHLSITQEVESGAFDEKSFQKIVVRKLDGLSDDVRKLVNPSLYAEMAMTRRFREGFFFAERSILFGYKTGERLPSYRFGMAQRFNNHVIEVTAKIQKSGLSDSMKKKQIDELSQFVFGRKWQDVAKGTDEEFRNPFGTRFAESVEDLEALAKSSDRDKFMETIGVDPEDATVWISSQKALIKEHKGKVFGGKK